MSEPGDDYAAKVRQQQERERQYRPPSEPFDRAKAGKVVMIVGATLFVLGLGTALLVPTRTLGDNLMVTCGAVGVAGMAAFFRGWRMR